MCKCTSKTDGVCNNIMTNAHNFVVRSMIMAGDDDDDDCMVAALTAAQIATNNNEIMSVAPDCPFDLAFAIVMQYSTTYMHRIIHTLAFVKKTGMHRILF